MTTNIDIQLCDNKVAIGYDLIDVSCCITYLVKFCKIYSIKFNMTILSTPTLVFHQFLPLYNSPYQVVANSIPLILLLPNKLDSL
jgi:hypothetical protein